MALVSPRAWFENLNDRERKLVAALAIVFVTLAVVVPALLVVDATSTVDAETARIDDVLSTLAKRRDDIVERQQARVAALRRYDKTPPPLGSFLETMAEGQSLSLREVTDEPEEPRGKYIRKAVRATLPNVELRPVIKMLASVENAGYPLAVTRLDVDHYGRENGYTFRFSVASYQEKSAARKRAPSVPGEWREP